jgi:hypothetical protein
MSPIVFTTYAHDKKADVRTLSDRLVKGGIDVRLDQYTSHPKEGWPKWMERQFREAEKVLIVPSKLYLERYNQDDGVGSGARFEGVILTSNLLKTGVSFENYAVAIFTKDDVDYVPQLLVGAPRYDCGTEEGFDALYRWITKQPAVVRPMLGTIAILKPLETSKKIDDESFDAVCRRLKPILEDNGRIFRDFGPNSGADSDGPVRFNLSAWYELRAKRILPNNSLIAEIVCEHRHLIPKEHEALFDKLLSHIDAFGAHVANENVEYSAHQFPKRIMEVIEDNL